MQLIILLLKTANQSTFNEVYDNVTNITVSKEMMIIEIEDVIGHKISVDEWNNLQML